MSAAGKVDALHPRDVWGMWDARFTGGAKRMFAELTEATKSGSSLTKEDLSRLANVELSGGSFGQYLSRLRTSGVLEESRDGIRIKKDLLEI